jgi:DNA (cytosine-5)-methyltransferase 1
MSKIYFNEIESFPAKWLRNYWAGAKVDERSIKDVESEILAGFLRCHFFAGIGGWEIALQQAGWPEDVPVWTGSCPCQPFSAAGKQKGTADERHLWPEFLRLIAACRPPHIFGEQVSGRKVTGKLFTPKAFQRLEPETRRAAKEADTEAWLKHVQTDLEGLGYIVGSVSFPACSVGAPHARQRLYWYAQYVGDTSSKRLEGRQEQSTREECHATERSCGSCYQLAYGNHKYKKPTGNPTGLGNLDGKGEALRLADRNEAGLSASPTERNEQDGIRQANDALPYCGADRLADLQRNQEHEELERPKEAQGGRGANEPCGCSLVDRPGPVNGHWRVADWIRCRDTDAEGNHRWRPVEPGFTPLAYGIPKKSSKISAGIRWLGLGPKNLKAMLRESKAILKAARASRNEQLSGYGNAIVIPQAVEFIRACMEEMKWINILNIEENAGSTLKKR